MCSSCAPKTWFICDQMFRRLCILCFKQRECSKIMPQKPTLEKPRSFSEVISTTPTLCLPNGTELEQRSCRHCDMSFFADTPTKSENKFDFVSEGKVAHHQPAESEFCSLDCETNATLLTVGGSSHSPVMLYAWPNTPSRGSFGISSSTSSYASA